VPRSNSSGDESPRKGKRGGKKRAFTPSSGFREKNSLSAKENTSVFREFPYTRRRKDVSLGVLWTMPHKDGHRQKSGGRKESILA